MRIGLLHYITIALTLFLIISWASIYTRDNSVFVARGSTPLTTESDVELTLWFLEGYVNMSIFIPQCHKASVIVYSKGGGYTVYEVKGVEGPLRETYMFKVPHPGFYSIQAKLRYIEGCEAPRVNGVINVYQYSQPEHVVRLTLLTPIAILLALTTILTITRLTKER